MIASGKIIDSNNKIIVGANIIESDSLGNYKTPILQVIESNINGNFNANFKENTFYTVSYIGTKKIIFNTKNGIPNIIKLIDDNTLPQINITSKQTYYWLIPIAILLIIAYTQKKSK